MNIEFTRIGYLAATVELSFQPGSFLLDARFGKRRLSAFHDAPRMRPRYIKLRLGISMNSIRKPRKRPIDDP